MDVTTLKNTIGEVRRKIADFEREHAQRESEHQAALADVGPHYREQNVNDAARALTRVEQQLAPLRQRLVALEQQLPSPEVVSAKLAAAASLSTALAGREKRCGEAWRAFMVAAVGLEATARECAQAFAEHRSVRAQLVDLVHEYGLEVEIPGAVQTPAVQREEVELIASIARQVASCGSFSDTAHYQLQAERAKQGAFVTDRLQS